MVYPNGAEVTYEYDDDCRLTKKTDPEGKKVDYTYLKSGKLSEIIDDNGIETQHFYDQAGRMIRVAYAAHLGDIQRQEYFYYDGVGNLTIKKLRSGDEIEYQYDARNMLSKKTYPVSDGRVIDYVYDDLGRVDSVDMTDYGTIGYEYDDLNRLTTVTHPGNVLVHYNYDKVGNRTRLTYPGSYVINYAYDGLNRMDLVQNAAYNTLADYGYDTIRRVNLRRYLDEKVTRTDYYPLNDADWIVSMKNLLESPATDYSVFHYTYDRAGNRRTMTRGDAVDKYHYNKRYELTDVDYASGSSFDDQTYIYDGAGNREGVIKGGTWVEYSDNPLNQYTYVDGATFSCDTNGNLTDDGTHTYYYDLDNRLTGIDGTITYKYDPFGRRIEKDVDGTITKYLYDGGRVIAEMDGSNNLIQRYIYGAGIDEMLILEKANGDKYWYYYDALGNVVNLTDNNGNLVTTYHYDVFGDFTESGTFTDNPYKFTGRRYDPESDL